MTELITLRNDKIEVKLCPEVGGSIFSMKFKLNGSWIDIMRPTPMAAAENKVVGSFSSFNLIPYSNIFEDGILKFGGKAYRLYKSSDSEHRSHGEARYKPNKVEKSDSDSAALSFDTAGFSDILWPFPFRSVVEHRIDNNKYIIGMMLENTGHSDMPGGLGIHPYFVRELAGIKQDVLVTIPMKGVYPLDGQNPTGPWEETPESREFSKGRILTGDPLDKCYRVHNTPSAIEWMKTGLRLTMTSSDMFGHIVIYCPEDTDAYFAVEPVGHCNNAFNMHEAGICDTGTTILKPGESISGTIELRLEA